MSVASERFILQYFLDRERAELYSKRKAVGEVILNKLTDEEKQILEQKILHDQSNYQIADKLFCSEKRIRYIYHKALEKVEFWLKE